MGLLGNGEGNTLIILTDAESRELRAHLESTPGSEPCSDPIEIFNRGVARGTAKLQQEFDELQREKKAKQK